MFGTAAILVVVAFVAAIASTVFSIWLLAVAFRRHVLWGLASLFLPFAVIVFAIKYWEEARRPFLYSLGTGLAASFLFIAAAFMGVGAASEHLAERMNEDRVGEMPNLPSPEEQEDGSRGASAETSGESEVETVAPSGRVDNRQPLPVILPPQDARTDGERVLGVFRYDAADITREGYVPVSLGEADRAVGRFAKVLESDGQAHRGELVRADAQGVELQRFVGGGTVVYRVPASRIDSILIDVRN
jgi:hypothetical protein